jgi:nucleoside-diphosphate-sugar epimerase
MNILITGGNGFIGGYLRNYFGKEHVVYAPGHSVLDLTNAQTVNKFFDEYKIDVVIHCALAGRDKINAIDPQLAIQNLEMFNNLWRNRHKFSCLINCGTGNEFDTSTNIDNAPENILYNHLPMASYGYAKNVIARIVNSTPEFVNLRLFGVFHGTENQNRFFKRLINATDQSPFRIFQDHQFDFVNLEDVAIVMNAVLNKQVNDHDINIVYREKRLLSEHALLFAAIHGIPQSRIIVEHRGSNNFTGDSALFDSYNFELKGLEAGFRSYRQIL